MDVVLIALLVVLGWTGAITAWLYYSYRTEIVEAVLEDVLRENATLKLAMEAANYTGDERKVYDLTLKALTHEKVSDGEVIDAEVVG